MSWNHRVVRIEEFGESLFMIQEVFYGDEGEPLGYAEPSMVSDTLLGLKQTLERMDKALQQPVLDAETDFKGGKVR